MNWHRLGSTIILLCLMCLTASAQDYPEIVFIFDASGSMSESAGGETKITAAKNVMKQIVPELDSNVRVGLIAYGHRRKGDCSDIEVLIPPGSTDRDQVLKKVLALKPVGRTPISDSVAMAVEMLRFKENETTVVLVSDGKETCAADPCAAVKQLKLTGIKFVLHTVGFDVNQEARQELECMAGAGGGKYFHAGDSAALLRAMQTISEEITEKVEVAKTTETKRGTGLGKLELLMPENTLKSMQGLQIVRVKDEKVIKETKRLEARSIHPMLDGQYDIHYLFAQPNFGKPTQMTLGRIEIARGRQTRIELGGIEFNIAEDFVKGDSRLNEEQVIVVEGGSGKPVAVVNDNNNGYYNYLPKAVPPGVYDIQIRYWNSEQPTTVATDVAVRPGKSAVATIDTGIRLKKASSSLTGWDLVPNSAPREAAEGEGQADSLPPTLQVRRRSDTIGPVYFGYAVPPGHYTLMIYIQGMDEPLPIAEDLEIKKGQLVVFDTEL